MLIHALFLILHIFSKHPIALHQGETVRIFVRSQISWEDLQQRHKIAADVGDLSLKIPCELSLDPLRKS